jgi:SAM-dependent methyltransferase
MDQSGDFFDGFAVKFDTLYDGQRNPFMQWVDRTFRQDMFERFALTFRTLGDLGGKSVLDIGCGSGPYMQEAIARGAARVIGIDPAPGMLELARNRLAGAGMLDRAELVHGYFPDRKLETPADVAIVMGVMDYVKDPVRFLQVLAGSVTQGAVVSFPGTHWLRSPLRRVRYSLRGVSLFLYSEESLRALLHRAGVQKHTITTIPGAGMDRVVWLTP